MEGALVLMGLEHLAKWPDPFVVDAGVLDVL